MIRSTLRPVWKVADRLHAPRLLQLAHFSVLVAAALLLSAASPPRAASMEDTVYDIPKLDGISIDGRGGDWGARGFRVGIIGADLRPADNFDASFRLGWDRRGLLVLTTIRDDVPLESENLSTLYDGDGVELFLLPRQGAGPVLQLVAAPGRTPAQPAHRSLTSIDGFATDAVKPLSASVRTPSGYVVEALLPWSGVKITPRAGLEVAFQMYGNDSDLQANRFQVTWFPRTGTHADPSAAHRIRLADHPSPPIVASARGSYVRMRRIRVAVSGSPDIAGKRVVLKSAAKTVATTVLSKSSGRVAAEFTLPLPPPGAAAPVLSVAVEGGGLYPVALPDPDEARARALLNLPLDCSPFVFDGPALPGCDFRDPGLAEDLIGPYTVRSTFYDSSHRRVSRADTPGRYGAVVEVSPRKGNPFRRHVTLYRTARPMTYDRWDAYNPRASLILPPEFGIEESVAAAQKTAINMAITDLLRSSTTQPSSAVLLAGLSEVKAGDSEPDFAGTIPARDRQWWVDQKRSMNGNAKRFPQRLDRPTAIDSEPAPVLRPGTPEEAGFKPDALNKIDTVLREWAADTDEGFAVVVARHGVVLLEKAYGTRNGRPMTTDDPSWMASITKLLSGTLMMMFIDQGLASLDDPVARFLPEFRGVKTNKPLTIRHLYTHTNDLWDHWGDELNDFEEIIAAYAPRLSIGTRHEYNGAGYALAGKVMEAISGESVPVLFKNRLFGPLGCTNTQAVTMSWDAQSTPMDIARVGQMLLNGGAYGNRRFFREETCRKMLPTSLKPILGPRTTLEWGIGTTWFTGEGLGKTTYAHGAASSATFRIDPENDLVIVMTRNAAGRNFNVYHPRFMKTIVDGMVKD